MFVVQVLLIIYYLDVLEYIVFNIGGELLFICVGLNVILNGIDIFVGIMIFLGMILNIVFDCLYFFIFDFILNLLVIFLVLYDVICGCLNF